VATNYERGRAFEYRVRDELYKRGVVAVVRSAGSKTKVDLVALWPFDWKGDAHVYLVQCKRDGKLPTAEREELLRIASETGTHPYHAHTGPNGRGVVLTPIRGDEK
jgi:Holliday junction resolvase